MGFGVERGAGGVVQASPAHSFDQMRSLEASVSATINEHDPQKAIVMFNSQFGMSEFAEHCLSDYWDSLNVFQRQQYVLLFSEVLQANLKKRFESLTKSKYHYHQRFQKIRSLDNGTWVAVARFESRDYSGTVEYVFKENLNHLDLIDYVLDGVSLSRNYRGHFNHVMRNRGFAGLLADLNNKLRELR